MEQSKRKKKCDRRIKQIIKTEKKQKEWIALRHLRIRRFISSITLSIRTLFIVFAVLLAVLNRQWNRSLKAWRESSTRSVKYRFQSRQTHFYPFMYFFSPFFCQTALKCSFHFWSIKITDVCVQLWITFVNCHLYCHLVWFFFSSIQSLPSRLNRKIPLISRGGISRNIELST